MSGLSHNCWVCAVELLLANKDKLCCDISLAAARNGHAKAEELVAAIFAACDCSRNTNKFTVQHCTCNLFLGPWQCNFRLSSAAAAHCFIDNGADMKPNNSKPAPCDADISVHFEVIGTVAHIAGHNRIISTHKH